MRRYCIDSICWANGSEIKRAKHIFETEEQSIRALQRLIDEFKQDHFDGFPLMSCNNTKEGQIVKCSSGTWEIVFCRYSLETELEDSN